jgi:glucosamine--fructose-6-phosphate aminotransferase (isomerizing)
MELGPAICESSEMNKFLTEILGQPKSLEKTVDFYCDGEGKSRLKIFKELFNNGNSRQIVFTGMGSSYFASYAAACLFNSLGIHSYAINTSELLYYHTSLVNRNTLIVCISQSGESFEVVKFLEMLPKDILCVGISNEDNSSLSKKANVSLLSRAGKEEMTSTKTYTAINLVIRILGWSLKGEWNQSKIEVIKVLITETKGLLDKYRDLIAKECNFFGDIDFIQFIGRGPAYASAMQSELMFKEAAKTPAAGTLGGEFRHGPMEMVSSDFKSILFAAEGNTYEQSIRMAYDIAKYRGKVLLITNNHPQLTNENIRTITISQPDEFLFSIQSIIPIQLMINYLALTKGFEPGNFVHGGKITLSE